MSHFLNAQAIYHAAIKFTHNQDWVSARYNFGLCITLLERYLDENGEPVADHFKWVTHNIPNIIAMVQQLAIMKSEHDYLLVHNAYNILKRFSSKFGFLQLAHFFQLAETCLTLGLSLSEMAFVKTELNKLSTLPYLPIQNTIDLFLANTIKTLVMLLQRECGQPNFPSHLLKFHVFSDELIIISAKITECMNNYMIQSALAGRILPETVLRDLVYDLLNKIRQLSEKVENLTKQRQQAEIDCHLMDIELNKLKKKLTQPTSSAVDAKLLPPISFFDKYLVPASIFSPFDPISTLLSADMLISLKNLSKRMAQLSERVAHLEGLLQFAASEFSLKEKEIERLRWKIEQLEDKLCQNPSPVKLFTPIILRSAGERTVPNTNMLTEGMGKVFAMSGTPRRNDTAANIAVDSDSDRTVIVSPASPS